MSDSDKKQEPVSFADAAGMIDVLHVDTGKGGKKAWKNPSKIEDIFPDLQTDLRYDFCKRDEKSGVQKRFRCNVCNCLIESVAALTEHVGGNRHKNNRDYRKQIGTEMWTLDDELTNSAIKMIELEFI
jgi:hypothetical protein